MKSAGFSTQTILAVVGVIIVVGAFLYAMMNTGEPTAENQTPIEEIPEAVEAEVEAGTQLPAGPQKPPVTSTPSGGQKSPTSSDTPPAGSGGTPGAESPAAEEPPQQESESAPEETPPLSEPYNPGFMAAARVMPGIPSENERAMLPSCDGKLFTFDPVNLSAVSSINPSGSSVGGVPEYAVFKVVGTGDQNKYDLVAPGDVWITHLAQETGITVDPEDTTIYFALCRDVIGYVTHVKELSSDIYKIITDSSCLGKPHTGPNACKIEVLKLISRGSSLGKVGRIEGSFGVGVIDLRYERGLANPAQYPIRTNFARCPFDYFLNASGYYNRLSASNALCTVP